MAMLYIFTLKWRCGRMGSVVANSLPNCRPLVSYSARSFRSAAQFGRPAFHFTAAPATSEMGISDKENGRAVVSLSCR